MIELKDFAAARRGLERAAQLERPPPDAWREQAKLWGRVAERASGALGADGRDAFELAFRSLHKAI